MKPVDEVLKHITLPFELHQYQIDDINRLAVEKSCGYYLAMGLGKSIMGVITGVYKLLHGYTTVVVLVPASIIPQWVELLTTLGVKVCNYKGTPVVREKLDLDVDFIVSSYQIFQNDYERFSKVKNFFTIIDEGTIMCNSENKLYRMVNGGIHKKRVLAPSGIPMMQKTQYPALNNGACLLTGTPINKPTDAYGLIKMISPDTYSSYFMFGLAHVDVTDTFGNPVKYKNLDVLHKNLTNRAVIREVSDHLDLPEKVYNVIEYDLAPAHLKLYKKILAEEMLVIDDKVVIDALEANKLYHLAQELVLCPEIAEYAADPTGLELLDTLVAGVKQAIIFNHHTSINAKIMKRYEAGGCFGDVGRKDQDKYVEDFKKGDLRLLVANTKSAGVGLNLQICNQVIFSELPITSRDFRQAEARCWRQGQKERVIVTVMVARKTIQKTLLRKIMERDDVSQQVLRTKKSLQEDLFP